MGRDRRRDRRAAQCGARRRAGASSRSARPLCGCSNSAATADGKIAPFCGETAIFITPGYRFKAVDMLLTNFHLPRSTLFMLVAAFSGLETMQAAYKHAIAIGLSLLFLWRCLPAPPGPMTEPDDSISTPETATARTGTLSLPRGEIRTPAFMPVGTAATVKAMYPQDVHALGADIVLGQHLSSDAAARRRAHRRARRPAQIHELAAGRS